MARVYLLKNLSQKTKAYIGIQVSASEHVIDKHKLDNIIPELHKDLKNDKFELEFLSVNCSMYVAEQLEKIYVNQYKPYYNENTTQNIYK